VAASKFLSSKSKKARGKPITNVVIGAAVGAVAVVVVAIAIAPSPRVVLSWPRPRGAPLHALIPLWVPLYNADAAADHETQRKLAPAE
jgi:hypothetical protein